jgi:hypothetical protein
MPFDCHLVIPDASGARILFIQDGSRWALPRVATRNQEFMGSAQADVLELLGLEIAMLRGVQFELDAADESSGDAFWYTENLSARSALGGHWFGEENLAGLDVVDERDRSLGARWFGERRGVASARLQPWQREGWFAAVSAWIRAVLLNVTGIEQFVVWSNSSVLRADTDGDRYYFKASQDLFRDEARVTAILAERFPGVVPVPVAIDGDRG